MTDLNKIQETYDWCVAHEFSPIVLHPNSKAAVSRDYVDKKYRIPPAGSFYPNKNIGVVLGPARKGPVDVDIDCPEAAFFAPYFLPKTDAVFGRTSKPRSHYLYVVKEPCHIMQLADKSMLFSDDAPKMMIELRGDASSAVQTVLPGSVHESGEIIWWSSEGTHEPAVVTADELVRAVKKVAAAVMVARHYWRPDYHAMDVSGMAYRSKWPLEDAIDFIKAIMEYDGDDDKSRIPTVRLTYRKADLGQKFTGATVLKSETGDHRGVSQLQSLMRGYDDEVGDAIAAFDEKWAVVFHAGKTRIASLTTAPGQQREYRDIDDFHQWAANERVVIVDDKGKSKTVPISKVWFPTANRNYTEFLPGVEECSVINEWTGWGVKPQRGTIPAFEELLRGLTKKSNSYDVVMTFLANVVREPMHKTKTILVFIGKQSAGKSLLFSYVEKMIGKFMVTASHPDQITGKFNDHLALSVLIVSEEAVYAGNHQHMNILKDISGRNTMRRETKGGACRDAPDYNRIVMLSNDHHAAPIEAGDTRYIVIDTGDFLCSRELRNRVVKERDSTGAAALLHYLLRDFDYDLGKLDEAKREMKKSDAVASMKRATSSTACAWWEQTLMDGQLLPLDCWSMQKPNDVRWPRVPSRRAVHITYSRYCEENRLKPITEGVFWSEMKRMTGCALETENVSFPVPNSFALDLPDWIKNTAMQGTNSKRRQANAIKDFPTLDECRNSFAAFMGQQYVWPVIEDDLPSAPEPIEY